MKRVAVRNVRIMLTALALPAAAMSAAAAPAGPLAPDAADVAAAAERLDFIPDPTRLTLPVSVGTAGPYRFIVDTGAERTVISAALADRLALAKGAARRIVTVGGSVTAFTARIPQLWLSATRSVRDVDAPLLAAADIGADGVLGIDALRGRTVLFDFRERSMTIAAATGDVAPAAPDEIVVVARSRRGRLVLGDARVERVPTLVVIDTGSEVTIGNDALRRALAAKRRLPPTYPAQIVTIAGERLTVDMIAVRALDVGGVTLQTMPIAFIGSPAFAELRLDSRPALLLGMDALRVFGRVSVDFGNRTVRFRP